MTSKSKILKAIGMGIATGAPLPDLDEAWIKYPDRQSQFVEVLRSVGGQALLASDMSTARQQIESQIETIQARKVVCTVPDLPVGNCELDTVDDPHALADVDLAIAAGEFAVAENGAVWVGDAGIKHRVVLFLAQHLLLVVPRRSLIDHMHDAYARLSFAGPGYGVFISGPSKTADIEQSLVIGAHGPRSLTVILAG